MGRLAEQGQVQSLNPPEHLSGRRPSSFDGYFADFTLK
jgi:hypothetical protein